MTWLYKVLWVRENLEELRESQNNPKVMEIFSGCKLGICHYYSFLLFHLSNHFSVSSFCYCYGKHSKKHCNTPKRLNGISGWNQLEYSLWKLI